MNSWPQNKIDPPPKEQIKFIKKMPMPKLYTAPALSRLCGIFYICMDSCPQNKIDPSSLKRIKFINKKMPMP